MDRYLIWALLILPSPVFISPTATDPSGGGGLRLLIAARLGAVRSGLDTSRGGLKPLWSGCEVN